MALSTGIDIVKVSRVQQTIKKSGNSFLKKIFTTKEIQYCNKRVSKYLSFAARFAAKEAFLKALGGRKGLSYKDIGVRNDRSGQPKIVLTEQKKKKLGISRKKIALSLAHEKEFAVAIVVIS